MTHVRTTQGEFRRALHAYKARIDDDIAQAVRSLEAATLREYGAQARVALDAYTAILGRGGKRIRGTLTLVGYELGGGRDEPMIVQAARAIEMIHAYLLIIDDMQDRSPVRRGGPAAHVQLADYHRQQHLADDPKHFGRALAMNAALLGNHAAHGVLAGLPVEPARRVQAIAVITQALLVTAHGQTGDILYELTAEAGEAEVARVLEWKTAHYSFAAPLQVGLILAGASDGTAQAVVPYALHIGRAYQITDDILGVFGTEEESGKSPLSDIREGKRTILAVYALAHADKSDTNFLLQMLGNQQLNPAEFRRCQDIFAESGALAHARRQAVAHAKQAIAALEAANTAWPGQGSQFLQGLAEYVVDRHA